MLPELSWIALFIYMFEDILSCSPPSSMCWEVSHLGILIADLSGPLEYGCRRSYQELEDENRSGTDYVYVHYC